MCGSESFQNGYRIFCGSPVPWFCSVIDEFDDAVQTDRLRPKQRALDLHPSWTSRLLMAMGTLESVSFLIYFFLLL